jgi:hypothetical protein
MSPVPRCINRLSSTILLRDTDEKVINEFVRANCAEYYVLPPNFEFRGVTILLNTPMLLGFKIRKKKILIPFVKPCYGPMLFEVSAEDGDFEFLRSVLKKEQA